MPLLDKGSVAAIPKATIGANFRDTETLVMKPDTIRSKFYEQYTAGVTYEEIVEELGISKRTASNWAREMGLPRRKGGPRRQRWMPGKRLKIR
jgi:hypothetical protein